jgi:hypothetical protein
MKRVSEFFFLLYSSPPSSSLSTICQDFARSHLFKCSERLATISDTSLTYPKFLMLHACFYTICLVFRYTSWYFYAFSGTNLLISRNSASSLFSAVFVF